MGIEPNELASLVNVLMLDIQEGFICKHGTCLPRDTHVIEEFIRDEIWNIKNLEKYRNQRKIKVCHNKADMEADEDDDSIANPSSIYVNGDNPKMWNKNHE